MPSARHRCTWDDIACLDADHIAGWGAFEPGCSTTVDFDDDDLPKLAFRMHDEGNAFSVDFQWQQYGQPAQGDFIHARIHLDRRPCRFGGTRAYFICPACGRRTLRLAVLPAGLRCGQCGRVTWGSRRERPTQRLLRRANKLAARLGCDSWDDQPTKPPAHMRLTTFERLSSEHISLANEINRRLAVRFERSSLFRRMATLARL